MNCYEQNHKETPIEVINGLLNIRGIVTTRGDEIRCWTPSEEKPGVTKTCLTRFDCAALADAFQALAESLKETP